MYKFSQFVLFNSVLFSRETSASCGQSTTPVWFVWCSTTLSSATATLSGVSGATRSFSGPTVVHKDGKLHFGFINFKKHNFFYAAVWDNALYRVMHALMGNDIRFIAEYCDIPGY